MRGRFIVLEGADGSGKTDQSRRLVDALQGRGISTVLTREPGGTPAAEKIREMILGEGDLSVEEQVRLHFEARALHIKDLIEPALAEGKWVVSDRYYHSTIAYQGFALDYPLYDLFRMCERCSVQPDLTIFLHVPPEVAEQRMSVRAGRLDRYERMSPRQQESVRAGYLMLSSGVFDNSVMIDADASREEVAEAILASVDPLIRRAANIAA